MLVVTTNDIPGKEFEVLGLVRGNVVRAKNIGRDLMAGFKNIAGGEIESYTQLMSESRDIALLRMVDDAQKLGADAVVAARLSSSSILDGTSEIIAYGTAVKFK